MSTPPRLLCSLALTTAVLVLVLPVATTAADESAGHFAVRVKTAELRGEWGRMWALLHPRQRAFIPRGLFLRCMRRVKSPRPRTIRVVSVRRRLAAVPGVSGPKVAVSTVELNIDFGSAAPSQRLLVRETRLGGAWYWINPAKTRSDFTRINFCS